MASPTVQATAVTAISSDSTTHVLNLPSGIVGGSRVIVAFVPDGVPTVDWTGTGFTQLGAVFPCASSEHTLVLAYRDCDGSEGSTISVGTDVAERSTALAWRIAGHDSSTAPERSTGATSPGTGTLADPDSLSPTGGSKDYLFLAITGNTNASPHTAPTNYTNLIEAAAGGGPSASRTTIGGAERALTAASDDPGTFGQTNNNFRWTAITVAVHPGAAEPELNIDAAAEGDTANDVSLVTEPVFALEVASGDPTLLSDDWTGTDTDPWDSTKWTISFNGSVLAHDIESNKGHTEVGTTPDANARSLGIHDAYEDMELLLQCQFEASGTHDYYFTLRGSGDWDSAHPQAPTTGYVVRFRADNGDVLVYQKTNGTFTEIGTTIAGKNVHDLDLHWLRFQVEGDQIRVKVWDKDESEPASWDRELTDTVITGTGVLQMSHQRAAAGPHAAFLDNLTLVTLEPVDSERDVAFDVVFEVDAPAAEPEINVEPGSERDVAQEVSLASEPVFLVELASETDAAFDSVLITDQTQAVGLAQESESAGAITPTSAISVLVSTVSEFEAARAIAAPQTTSVATAVELEIAQATFVDASISLLLNTAIETEATHAIAINRSATVGAVLELESSSLVDVIFDLSILIGVASEEETARIVGASQGDAPQSRPVLSATESETAQVIGINLTVLVSLALESETATLVNSDQSISVGLVSESETASATSPLVGAVSIQIGLVAETEASHLIVSDVTAFVGAASEIEQTHQVTVISGQSILVASASEIEDAVLIGASQDNAPQTRPVQPASEIEISDAVVPIANQVVVIGTTSETESVSSVTAHFALAVGSATESEVVTVIGVKLSVGTSNETEVAGLVGVIAEAVGQTISVDPATELELANGVVSRALVLVGAVVESEFGGQIAGIVGQVAISVGTSLEIEFALSVLYGQSVVIADFTSRIGPEGLSSVVETFDFSTVKGTADLQSRVD